MLNQLKKYLWNPIINSAHPRFCVNLLDWSQREKWPTEKIHEPSTHHLPIPNGCEVDEKIMAAYAGQQHIEFPAQYLVCIPNAFALGGFARLPSGEFLTESDWRVRDFLASDISRSRFRRHKLHLDGDCYYLDVLFSGNYGHWLSDELPRLANALSHMPSATRFIVSDPIQQYKSESLAVLGVTGDRLVPVKGYYEVRCERLWYVTPANDMVWNPIVLNKIKDASLRIYGNGGEPALERIFVSRNNIRWKRLANEDELLPLIEGYGFSIIRPEQMSFAQQVKTFSKAKVVFGAYGAGLTNLLFCQPARFLELQDSLFAPRPWYWKWASMLGHEYWSMTGPVTESKGYIDTNFSIHPDSLKQCLENILSPKDFKSKNQWWVSK